MVHNHQQHAHTHAAILQPIHPSIPVLLLAPDVCLPQPHPDTVVPHVRARQGVEGLQQMQSLEEDVLKGHEHGKQQHTPYPCCVNPAKALVPLCPPPQLQPNPQPKSLNLWN